MKKVYKLLKQLPSIFLLLIAKICSFFHYTKKEAYWIIIERGFDARDNGYFFYKYLKENHPQQRVYFIIEKESSDLTKIHENDRLINKSFKHMIYAINSQCIISTHRNNNSFNDISMKIFNILRIKKMFIFLQHGITKDYLPFLCKSKYFQPTLFITGARPEYEYVLNEFGHSKDVVKYTGLCRFDNLYNYKNETTDTILIMPTWRQYLKNVSNEEFLHSNYFKKWNSLLTNEKLNLFISERNFKIIFYPHIEMQKYIHNFEIMNENVVIAKSSDFDVQELLISSKLLITDYSSVFFDFAYMNKPIIFYQFDYEEFRESHYNSGYFDYKSNAMGKLYDDEYEIVKETIRNIENNFNIDSKFIANIIDFFVLRDNKNCDRIYKLINEVVMNNEN